MFHKRLAVSLLTGCSWGSLIVGYGSAASAQQAGPRFEAQSLPPGPIPASASRQPRAGTLPTGLEAAEHGSQVDEIIVTARKVRENIVSTPVAITALSAAALQARDIVNLATLGNFTPGFHQTDVVFGRVDRGYQTYEMRGIYGGDGQERQPVGLFIDGAPLASGMIEGLDDLDHVEVIKGPQSAYFGRSTFAGGINFVTRPPGNQVSAAASLEYGSYNYTELKGEVEGPIVKDVLSARISGRYFNTDGQYDNAYGSGRTGSQETRSLSADVSFNPTSYIRMKGFAQVWRDVDGPSSTGLLNKSYFNCNPSGGATFTYVCGAINEVPAASNYTNVGFSSAVIDALTSQRAANNVDSRLVDHVGLGRAAWQSVISFEGDLPGKWLLSGNLGVADDQYRVILDLYGQPARTALLAETVNHFSDFSGELRLQSPTYLGIVKGLVGVNYLDSSSNGIAVRYAGTASQTDPALVAAGVRNSVDYTKTYSRTLGLFGSLHFDFTPKLKLDLEGREQSDNITQKVIPDALSAPGNILVVASKTFYTFTPKATLSYLFRPNLMAYASYAVGSRPGQFNVAVYGLDPATRASILAQANVSLAVAPEKLEMYEIGLKGDFLERRLRLLLSAYSGRWTGRQVSAPVAYVPLGGTTQSLITVVSGGSTVNLYGFEAEGSFRVNENLTLEGTFAYNESDIRKTYCISCYALTGNANPVGNVLPGYAPVTGTASLNYVHDVFGLPGFFRLDYIYSGKQYDQEDNLAYISPSNRVNLRAGISMGNYAVELYGRNVFNDKTPNGIFTQSNFVQGGYAIKLAPPIPASFGVRVSAKF